MIRVLNSFRWWHRVRGHHLVRLYGDRPTEVLVFENCRDCPDDRGWCVGAIQKPLTKPDNGDKVEPMHTNLVQFDDHLWIDPEVITSVHFHPESHPPYLDEPVPANTVIGLAVGGVRVSYWPPERIEAALGLKAAS